MPLVFHRFFPVSSALKSRARHFPCGVVLLWMLLLTPFSLFAINAEETSVKAAFLYNFFKFVQWPDTADQQTYTLCLPHPGQFTNALKSLEGKVLNGRELRVFLNTSPTELRACHMLFIPQNSDVQELIAQSKLLAILTVSDQPEFIEQGGMIGLVPNGNKLSFEVNLSQARIQGVHISAELLKLAQKVIK